MGQIKNIKLHIVTDIKGIINFIMIIPKKNRVAIYESLFKDGVMVALKDFNQPKHNELDKVRNLEVIKAMQSLKSRGYVRENFAWRHYYWYLRSFQPHSGKQPNHRNPGSETNVVQVVKVVLHGTVMVETGTRTDVKVVVVMHAWTRAVPETTSNQSSVVEWEVSEEVVVDLQVVVDSVLHH